MAQYTGRDMPQRMPHRTPQGMPHRAAEPRVPPVARLPQAVDPQPPIFIDQSGWRRWTLQGLALVVGCTCLGYLAFVGTVVSDLWQPVGTQPPSTNGPVSTRGDGDGDADAGREDHRPPAADRAAPPAGGLKQ
ncbi:hypothetical protein M4V62_10365 [Streptomyces durmitorensis]|uniref:Uncharacterized protein n=1 Tax=Streptomyces durmitorensis TaxID=319947 RepID=A0ABY4PR18_9ACTN|nr:hypothetical protein [Streptomyces durmitorensis]UQT55461.1 hypothetical protein M4V62_10365 [Streptomyces durmitorensis]